MEKPDDTSTPNLTPAEALKIATKRVEAAIAKGEEELDLTDLAALRELPNAIRGATSLRVLRLGDFVEDYTEISDLSPLSALTGLGVLDLNNTPVQDLSPLSALTGLTELSLDSTPVHDLSPLSALTGLTELYLNNTPVQDLSPLFTLTRLTELYLDNTLVQDLSPLSALTGLEKLDLDNTQVRDLRPILPCTKLAEDPGFFGLTYKNTPATQNDPVLAELAGIENAKERGEKTFAHLRTLPPWPEALPQSPPSQDPNGFQVDVDDTGRISIADHPIEIPLDAAPAWDALKQALRAQQDHGGAAVQNLHDAVFANQPDELKLIAAAMVFFDGEGKGQANPLNRALGDVFQQIPALQKYLKPTTGPDEEIRKAGQELFETIEKSAPGLFHLADEKIAAIHDIVDTPPKSDVHKNAQWWVLRGIRNLTAKAVQTVDKTWKALPNGVQETAIVCRDAGLLTAAGAGLATLGVGGAVVGPPILAGVFFYRHGQKIRGLLKRMFGKNALSDAIYLIETKIRKQMPEDEKPASKNWQSPM